MRITTSQLYDNLTSGVRQQLEVQDRGNAKVASGTRFQTPSEAGLDYKKSLDIRHAQSSIQGSLDAIAIADSRLGISQTMLTDMGNVLTRAQTLAVQQSNGGLGAAERQAAANEVAHLLDRFLSDANQTWQGQSIFAGTAVDQPAFVQDNLGNVTYNGSDQDRTVAIESDQQVVSNLRGDAPGFVNAFSALKSFQTALENNDTVAIQTSLESLNNAGESIIDLTADVGSRLNAVRIYNNSFEDLKTHLEKKLNEHEAVDIAAVVTELQQSNTALQATYSLIAQIKSLSLTNFLR